MANHVASHIYVYYRVAADTAPARAGVAALLAAVEAKTGVMGRLLVRCDDPHTPRGGAIRSLGRPGAANDDPATWMEVYEPVPYRATFMRTLAALAKRHGVGDIAVDGVRHTECFAPPPVTASAN